MVIVVVIIVVVAVTVASARVGVGATSEQFLELAAVEPDASACVAAVEGDAVAIELGEG